MKCISYFNTSSEGYTAMKEDTCEVCNLKTIIPITLNHVSK